MASTGESESCFGFEAANQFEYLPKILNSTNCKDQLLDSEKAGRAVSRAKSEYIPGIDGLRALAVIVVIINHFNKNILPGGFLGVDIFFVISGYVITSSLYDRPGRSVSDLFLGFYTRRVKRLVPALVACVVVTGFLISLFDPNPGISLRTGIASLFGFSNLYLLRQATDYFGTSAQFNVFTQTWSLGVEEQFYIIFPFFVWFSGFGRLNSGVEKLLRLIGVLSIISLIMFFRWNNARNPAAFFIMPTRFWELSAGALVFLVLNNSFVNYFSMLSKRITQIFVVGTLVCILLVPVNYSTYTTIAVVFLTALLIVSIRLQSDRFQVLAHPAAVYVGRISYSLYLWHWSVISISRWTIGINIWTVPFQIGTMLILAVASYRYIEKPLRTAVWSASRWRSIFYGFCSLVFAAGLLWLLAKPLEGKLYSGRPPALVASGVRSLTDVYVIPGVSSWQGEKCVLSENSQVGKIIPTDECTLGNFSKANRRILVVGNSFSTTFVQAFDQLVLFDKYSVTITSSWGASPVAEVPNSGIWDKANKYYWEEVVPEKISRLQSGDWVFLISDLAEFSPEKSSAESDRRLRQLIAGLLRLSGQLSERGVRLAVLHGNPFSREANCEPVTAARQWFAPFGSSCRFISKVKTLSRREKLDDSLASLQRQGIISIVDLFEVFCPGTTCTYEANDGQMLYRDVYSHPSVEAARLSAPTIRAVLTAPTSVSR